MAKYPGRNSQRVGQPDPVDSGVSSPIKILPGIYQCGTFRPGEVGGEMEQPTGRGRR